MPSAFEHGPAITVPASNTTAKAAVIWSAASNLGESTIILDSGGNGRIGIAGDLDTITITSGTVTVAGIVAATTLTGAGSGITALNGTQVTSGTLPAARIGDDSIVEAKLDVSNGPTDGYFLQAQSGEGGGLTWAEVSGGTAVAGTTDNGILTFVNSGSTFAAESSLTYNAGQLTLNYDSGAALFYLDSSTGQSLIKYKNAGTAKWDVGIDPDGSGNQKSHVDDWCMYNGGTYGVVISGNGSNQFGIGTQAGIALSGAEIPDDGIQFPASVALSSNANNLDDYQEGTFTPILHDWSFDGNEATHTSQVGRYQKIGRFVYFWGTIHWSSIGTLATGSQGLIGGLPYTCMTGTNYNASVYIGHAYGLGLPSAGDSPCATINAGTAYMSFHVWSITSGAQSCNFSQWGPNPAANFAFSGMYETNS